MANTGTSQRTDVGDSKERNTDNLGMRRRCSNGLFGDAYRFRQPPDSPFSGSL